MRRFQVNPLSFNLLLLTTARPSDSLFPNLVAWFCFYSVFAYLLISVNHLKHFWIIFCIPFSACGFKLFSIWLSYKSGSEPVNRLCIIAQQCHSCSARVFECETLSKKPITALQETQDLELQSWNVTLAAFTSTLTHTHSCYCLLIRFSHCS